MDGKLISVVIVNWNSGRLLETCVRSLRQHAEDSEIIVVDNASTDSSLQFAAEAVAQMRILRNDRNLGFAAANNIGWRAGQGDCVLFLNPDTECLSGSVGRLAQALSIDGAVWAIGGHLVGPSGESQTGFNVRAFPTVGRAAAEMLFLDEIWPAIWRHRAGRAASGSLPMDVDQPAAACLMVTRAALETAQGFDEAFRPAWFEDVDLCRRIRDLGGRIQYHPGARFLHHGGHSLRFLSRQSFLESFHTNQIRYFLKHHGARSARQVRKCIVFGLLFRSALSFACPPVRGESRVSSAKAYWKAARHIGEMRGVEL